jgi:hypothetical protein
VAFEPQNAFCKDIKGNVVKMNAEILGYTRNELISIFNTIAMDSIILPCTSC